MPPRQDVLSCVGLSLPEVFYRLVPQVDHGERDLAEKAFKEYFAGQRADQPDPGFYAGILPLLRQFHQDPRFILGVATGNSRRGLNALLEAGGLHSYFLTTQTADEHPSKPHHTDDRVRALAQPSNHSRYWVQPPEYPQQSTQVIVLIAPVIAQLQQNQ